MTMSKYAENITFTIEGVRYEWAGGFGSVVASRENKCKVGEVRSIAGHLFKVFMIDRRWLKDKVCWHPVADFDMEWVRKFKLELLG